MRNAARRVTAPPRQNTEMRWVCGPFEGVRDVVDAGSQDYQRFAQDALNCYLADTARGRSLYTRPGCIALNGFNGVVGTGTGCVHHHTTLNGTEYRFAIVSGQLFWIDAAMTTYLNVTPAGTAISTTYRPAMLSFGDSIIVTDGVDRPWIMGGLAGATLGTPVTRTYISYNSGGSAWTAWGRPTVAAGKLVFVIATLNGVPARNAIMWSEEADATVGYQQSGYDNLWELTQSDTDALTAVVGTNSGIVVFREDSITRIEGLNVDQFQTSATFDGISTTVGCPYWATVVRVGRHIWFAGRDGKVYRLHEDGALDEPWKDMALTVTRRSAESGAPASLTLRATAEYCPDLNLILFALWKGTTSAVHPQSLYVFDATTARHCGRWQLGRMDITDTDAGVEIMAMAPLKDSTGRYTMAILNTQDAVNGTGYVSLRRIRLASEGIFTDSYSSYTQDDQSFGQYAINAVRTHLVGNVPQSRVVVDRVVTEHAWDPDDAGDSVKLQYHTPALSASPVRTATLKIATDRDEGGHARATFGLGPNAQGRWIRFTSSVQFAELLPVTSQVQFGFERITAIGYMVRDTDEF